MSDEDLKKMDEHIKGKKKPTLLERLKTNREQQQRTKEKYKAIHREAYAKEREQATRDLAKRQARAKHGTSRMEKIQKATEGFQNLGLGAMGGQPTKPPQRRRRRGKGTSQKRTTQKRRRTPQRKVQKKDAFDFDLGIEDLDNFNF